MLLQLLLPDVEPVCNSKCWDHADRRPHHRTQRLRRKNACTASDVRPTHIALAISASIMLLNPTTHTKHFPWCHWIPTTLSFSQPHSFVTFISLCRHSSSQARFCSRSLASLCGGC